MYIEATIAPNGGFSSSMTRDISTGVKVWIPKTQIENGNISEWIAKNKTKCYNLSSYRLFNIM